MNNKIELYVNPTKEKAAIFSKEVEKKLLELNYIITDDNPDIVIGFGGDGTLLHFLVKNKYNVKAKYIGVNCGTLGFLQDFKPENAELLITNIPNYIESKLNFLNVKVFTENEVLSFEALNDIDICTSSTKSLRMNVSLNDEFLEDFVGTGLLFASQTGSTARNLSCTGSIIFEGIEAYMMTPREPTSNGAIRCLARSICIPKHFKTILTPNSNEALLVISDSNISYNGKLKKIEICYSDKFITKLTKPNISYISRIRESII